MRNKEEILNDLVILAKYDDGMEYNNKNEKYYEDYNGFLEYLKKEYDLKITPKCPEFYEEGGYYIAKQGLYELALNGESKLERYHKIIKDLQDKELTYYMNKLNLQEKKSEILTKTDFKKELVLAKNPNLEGEELEKAINKCKPTVAEKDAIVELKTGSIKTDTVLNEIALNKAKRIYDVELALLKYG